MITIQTRKFRYSMKRLEHKFFSLVNRIRSHGKPKVKLVAIAKNESAYLSDWIFHHLYFGFDAVDIYVNNTTDNTYSLLKKFDDLEKLTIKDGNPFFEQTKHSPQVSVYLDALKKSKRQGYSHVLFLDIDEFWTPLDFESKIDAVIRENNFDVMAFEWIHKVDDEEPFSKPFEQTWLGVRSRQVKVLLDTDLEIKGMNAHNVINTKGNFILANGKPFISGNQSFSQVQEVEMSKPLKPVFLLHRSNRSQLEYIAGLDRGTPVQSRKKQSKVFKYNRSGYMGRNGAMEISFAESSFMKYEESRQKFYDEYSLSLELNSARSFVELQKNNVVKLIESAGLEEERILQKVLTNVTLPEVKQAYANFQRRNSAD